MKRCYFLGLVCCVLVGCTATAPRSNRVSHDPLLARQGGVLLLVDAFVQRDGFGNGDYFVINEAEAGAKAALESLKKYVKDSDIPVRSEVISVCGARLGTNNSPIKAADSAGSPRREATQPLRVSGANAEDSAYVRALGVISTYAFERAALPKRKDDKSSQVEEATSTMSMDDFRAAADVIKSKTQASSVLFLGVLGTSRSGGKAAAQTIGGLIAGIGLGTATAVATGGLGAGFYLVFAPGFQMIDGMIMEGALIDLESGQLTWSNAVRVTGDPIHPKAMANSEGLDLLFHSIMFQPVPK